MPYPEKSSDSGPWTNYTPTITGSTINPTLATTKTLIAHYRVVGKSLQIAFTYYASNATGTEAGSGAYLFGLPAGFSIDTAVAPTVTMAISSLTGNFCGASASTLGSGIVTGGIYSGEVMVVGVGTNLLGLFNCFSVSNSGSNTVSTLVGSGAFPVTLANTYYKFTAEVPIL